jgi:hypothetical protein
LYHTGSRYSILCTTTVRKSCRMYEWESPKEGDEMRESARTALVPCFCASSTWLRNEGLLSRMMPKSFTQLEAAMVMLPMTRGTGR